MAAILFLMNAGVVGQSMGKYSASQNFKPRFDRDCSPLRLKVEENTKPGFLLRDINNCVTDDENDILSYRIDSGVGSEICTIDKSSGELKLKISPDREEKSSYRFKVFASDNFEGGINREASLNVELRILDQNDNRPVFQNTTYHADIPENVDVGSTILKVLATDRDDAANKDVLYFFKEGTDHGHFQLDQNSGTITVAKGLDYENKSRYDLYVVAKDEGIPELSGETKVIMNVADIGDTRPYFLAHSCQKDVKENLPKGERICKVEAKDGDKGVNNEINYAITAGDPYGLFHINNKTGVITVEGDIDRESYVNIELNITAYEVPQLESSATIKFKITFLDENDNKPKFDKESYLVKVEKQNLNAGTILTKSIKATDEDATVKNNEIIYSLRYDDDKYFNILSDSGVLVLRNDLTNITSNKIIIFVYAREKFTKEGYTAIARVTVQIVPSPSAPTFRADNSLSSAYTGNVFIVALSALCALFYL